MNQEPFVVQLLWVGNDARVIITYHEMETLSATWNLPVNIPHKGAVIRGLMLALLLLQQQAFENKRSSWAEMPVIKDILTFMWQYCTDIDWKFNSIRNVDFEKEKSMPECILYYFFYKLLLGTFCSSRKLFTQYSRSLGQEHRMMTSCHENALEISQVMLFVKCEGRHWTQCTRISKLRERRLKLKLISHATLMFNTMKCKNAGNDGGSIACITRW